MLDLQPATFEQFLAEAGRGNVVPVVRSVLADLQTPVGAFMRVAASAPYAFLLESIEGGERVARYSFLGVEKGGVREIPITGERAVLTDEVIRRLARAADQIKRVFGGRDQDIEWAYMKGQIFIVQSRPYISGS